MEIIIIISLVLLYIISLFITYKYKMMKKWLCFIPLLNTIMIIIYILIKFSEEE